MTTRFAIGAGMVVAAIAVVIVFLVPEKRTSGVNQTSSADSREERAGSGTAENTGLETRRGADQSDSSPRDKLDGQPALNPPEVKDLSQAEAPPLAGLLGKRGSPPKAEARILLDVLDAYRRLMGAYPAGEDNRQFVNALLGANREKLPFLSRNHPRLNSRGEIVDAWGTPFFFHLNSRTSIQVRSAGPDKVFFTGDDITAGPSGESARLGISEEEPPVQ